MPLIQVYHPENSLAQEQKAALSEMLTRVVLEIEGGEVANIPNGRSIAWVMFHDVRNDSWTIGGKTDDTYVSPPGKFLVRVYVPEGSLSRERKAMVHRTVDEAFFEAFGLDAAAEQRQWPSVFVHIHEWAEGNVGGFGKTHGLADIGAYVGVGDPQIRARGQQYLKARAGLRASAGFPD